MVKEELREAITLENQGQKIFAVLHRPLQEGRVPAIVICPGFGGNKCGKFRIFVILAQQLAKKGIAVLRFDYRCSGDSEGEFQEITLEGKISDALQCLNFLSDDPQIDPSRLGILGRSLGGAVGVLAARRFQKIKSLALWAPVFKSDPWKQIWESFKRGQPGRRSEELLRHLPVNVPNLDFLNQFFNLNMVQELSELQNTPLLHIHGELDQVVKIEHARDFEKARIGLENTRFIQLPKSDHDFSDADEQAKAIQETCEWFCHTL